MTAIQTIPPRREPLTPEDHQDRWNEAQRSFMKYQDEESRDTMLRRYAAFYRALCSGSSVGLEEELDRLERRADGVIRQRKIREGIPT